LPECRRILNAFDKAQICADWGVDCAVTRLKQRNFVYLRPSRQSTAHLRIDAIGRVDLFFLASAFAKPVLDCAK
jgi:hypothetical protein